MMTFLLSWGSLNMQDSSSPIMAHISSFHDHAMMIVIVVVSLVAYLIVSISMNKKKTDFLLSSSEGLEIVWTIVPSLVLVFMALPSLYSLYLLDEVGDAMLTVKVSGHQWYWSYEYSDFENIEFDSYMIESENLNYSDYRLLSVDKNTVLPLNVETRILVTSSDVIHSWAVPSLGLKVDAIPGRLNQVNVTPIHIGESYGQCSEICGPLHSFMPICLEICPEKDFFRWLKGLSN